jgi:SAM-dependent methyltransferase
MTDVPRLYQDLSSWFHLLSRPEDYNEEAEFARQLISTALDPPAETLLELGSGGGNNAFHLKASYQITLTDVSAGMLEASRRINPECEHIQGDMRTMRLGRTFDGVFIHDAVMYMTTFEELRAAIRTAAVHCRPGGVALIMPDCVQETLRSGVYHHGGHDVDDRALRYIEWTFDPDRADSVYSVDFVYMLREGAGPVRVVHDHHEHGVFPRNTWLNLLLDEGFINARAVPDAWGREVFLATRRNFDPH